jgi:hypothetical protein
MKDTCLNCGKEVEIGVIFVDEIGSHAKCPDCGSSFDIDTEIINNLKPLSKSFPLSDVGLVGHIGLDHIDLGREILNNHLHKELGSGIIIVDVEKEKINNFEKKFMSYMCGLGNLIVPIGFEKQKTVQDYLRENKINSFVVLKREWELINNKKSKLSSSMRKNIEIAYKAVTKE